MRFLALFAVAVAALVLDTTATVIRASNDTSSSILPRFVPGGSGTFMDRVDDHGEPFCSGTGEGICNLAFVSPANTYSLLGLPSIRDWFTSHGGKHDVFVYDRECRLIGRAKKVKQKFTIKGELPYKLSGNTRRQMFTYFDKKNIGPYYTRCVDYYWGDKHITQCAFECWQGCYKHGEGAPAGIKCNPDETWGRSDGKSS
ncbi:hypothetical protein PVAG01_01174 [Phlyctema vagabunda]|uniref:Uncharacterized protein n=1 Tax=Phlyctema vagabunda TaxID=108571 RepID=A0ABR4PWC3_9HELO